MHQIFLAFALFLTSTPVVEQKSDPAINAQVTSRISVVKQWAADPVIVEAVREANGRLRSMREIAEIDERWQAASGVDDFMRSIINHPAARHLRELRASSPELQEAFVTDRLGANVATTNKTSDFFQGDEEKFTRAFNDGDGATHVGRIKRDESIQSYSVQIAVPVLDQRRAIGVLIVTVNVEKLKRTKQDR